MKQGKDIVSWAFWITIICAFILIILLIKGCCAQKCEVMLAECEKGLNDMIDREENRYDRCICVARLDVDDAGCE